MVSGAASNRSVALVSLGCARNDVDGEELAAHLEREGWTVVTDPADAAVALINTCGFIEAAKKDSIDAVLEAAELKNGATTRAVVAVGCLAQRYGRELAQELPEADAVLGFDAYPELSQRLDAVLRGEPVPSHEPRDRRTLLPVTPVDRPRRAARMSIPGHQHAHHHHHDQAQDHGHGHEHGHEHEHCLLYTSPSPRDGLLSRMPSSA